MAGTSATKIPRGNKSRSEDGILYDLELEDLPPELRWREWMLRIEAVIFASAEPVSRETLARVVGKDCSIELLIDDLREELSSRPHELVSVAEGWQHRTRARFGETIRASSAPTRGGAAALSEFEAMVLMAVGYFRPVTRAELSKIFGKEVSRDTIGALRGAGFIGSGPRWRTLDCSAETSQCAATKLTRRTVHSLKVMAIDSRDADSKHRMIRIKSGRISDLAFNSGVPRRCGCGR